MIPFTPKRVSNPTLFFFHRKYSDDLLSVLDDNLVTGWELHSLQEAIPYLPENTAIPNVYSFTDDRKAADKDIAVFVSYYDADDMAQFLRMVEDHPETIERHQAEIRRRSHLHEWEQKWADDPAPWSLAAGLK